MGSIGETSMSGRATAPTSRNMTFLRSRLASAVINAGNRAQYPASDDRSRGTPDEVRAAHTDSIGKQAGAGASVAPAEGQHHRRDRPLRCCPEPASRIAAADPWIRSRGGPPACAPAHPPAPSMSRKPVPASVVMAQHPRHG